MKKVLSKIWQGWKRFAHVIARVNTVLLLTLFYFLISSPLGAIMSLFGWAPLDNRKRHIRRGSNWKPVTRTIDHESLRRQS